MRPVTSFPFRLYLLELAHYEANGVPVQGYLIQTSDGMNILVDTGWPQEMIGAYKRPGGLGVYMDEEDFLASFAALPRVYRPGDNGGRDDGGGLSPDAGSPGDAGTVAKPVADDQFWFPAHSCPDARLQCEPLGRSPDGLPRWLADADRGDTLTGVPLQLTYLGNQSFFRAG